MHKKIMCCLKEPTLSQQEYGEAVLVLFS